SGHPSYDLGPIKAREHTEYVVRGATYNKYTVAENVSPDIIVSGTSGVKYVIEALDNLKNAKLERKLLLNLSACNGGCIFGEGVSQKRDQFTKLNRIKDYDMMNMDNPAPIMPLVPISKKFNAQYEKNKIDDTSIIELLQKLTIDTSKEYLNCGACGYSDCKEFAKQMISGYAHKEMCLWFRKSSAKMTLTTFIKGLPFGVAIVDTALAIRSSNLNFARALGPEAILAYETHTMLKGLNAKNVMPQVSDYIEEVFDTNKEKLKKDIQIKDKLLKFTIIKIENIDKVIVIVRNLFQNDVQNDEIVNRTRTVIDDNLKTVQQIAYLLGETASRTEAVLNSIIESQTVTDENI
ncbi:MAG: (Fe-S)-binding protein, partial [Rikenellaceae bacterium]